MVNEKDSELQHLFELYVSNGISREDYERLLHKVNSAGYEEDLKAILKDYWEKTKEKTEGRESDWNAKFEGMMQEIKHNAPVVRMPVIGNRTMLRAIAAAVVVAFILGAASYFIFSIRKNEIAVTPIQKVKLNSDLLPGSRGAILTLANGKQIVLDSVGNGMLAVQGSTKVVNRNGLIVYEDEKTIPDSLLYNTITTPNGRQYQLMLADGSKVWLNAASSIRYPAAFAEKERRVDIKGEAYFEVTHNAQKPFKVYVNNIEVQVLGTHFNINSYHDEATMQTTLLEGSVKITKNKYSNMLSPGQQAQINNNPSLDGSIKILKDIDLDAVMAWKNGYFSFGQTDLGTLMRQIARWYDVEVVYAGTIPSRRFGGEISRNTNLSEVLKALEESKVHFRIQGKKIIVEP